MEEDEFELVSKETIRKLKEENEQLKSQKNNNQGPKSISIDEESFEPIVKKVVSAVQEQTKKDQEEVHKTLEEIKELNKSTLDNLLTKTQGLESKLESTTESLRSLVSTLSEVLEVFDEKEQKHMRDSIHRIDEYLQKRKGEEIDTLFSVQQELKEIDQFMRNLKILLSYVKPNDMTMEAPRNNQGNGTQNYSNQANQQQSSSLPPPPGFAGQNQQR